MHKNELPGDKADWADRLLRNKFLVISQRQMWNETVRRFEAFAQHFSAELPAQFANRSIIGEKHERMLGRAASRRRATGKAPEMTKDDLKLRHRDAPPRSGGCEDDFLSQSSVITDVLQADVKPVMQQTRAGYRTLAT